MGKRLGLIRAVVILLAVVSLWGCRRLPRGDWHIETGYARLVDDEGTRRTRVEAIEDARHDAHLKILSHVEAMPASGSNLVGDFMAHDLVTGVRVRSLILSARRFAARYNDTTVELDMGVNLDDVRKIVREGKRSGQPQG
jgi:hypothetical protein